MIKYHPCSHCGQQPVGTWNISNDSIQEICAIRYSLYYPEWPIQVVIAFITSYSGSSICEHTNFDSYNSIKVGSFVSTELDESN